MCFSQVDMDRFKHVGSTARTPSSCTVDVVCFAETHWSNFGLVAVYPAKAVVVDLLLWSQTLCKHTGDRAPDFICYQINPIMKFGFCEDP